MRLLERSSYGEIRLVGPFKHDEIPPYAILSHRWEGDPGQEVDFGEMMSGQGCDKAGYKKIVFCAEQAARDNLNYFWVDTCCINKSLEGEHQQAIRSMFRWYRLAKKCYVYLFDVPGKQDSGSKWEEFFKASQWFKRGWTLQELLAPRSVEFFSTDGKQLGDKSSLEGWIHKITGIPSMALKGQRLANFSTNERFSWMERRQTSLEEDKVYALLGVLDVEIPIHYGEGWSHAYDRLKEAMATQDQIIRDLYKTNASDDKKRIQADKGGLLPDICNWIFSNNEFRQWRSALGQCMLWIRGDPGKGKTMLICNIIDELEKAMPNENIISYFFCQATDARINNATAVLRGLLYMLVIQQPSLISHLDEKYCHTGAALFEDANSWTALKDSLSIILQDSQLTSTVLIVDGLDECIVGLPKLLQFIAERSQRCPKVKWLLSSRDWPNIEQPFRNVQHMLNLRLELNAESVSQAVQFYIQDRVNQLTKDKNYDESLRRAVLQTFQLNAKGTFLWVALVFDSLCNVRKKHVRSKLNDFPAGLNGLYNRMMNQIQDDTDSFNICRQILAVVSLVFRPITINELCLIVDSAVRASPNLEDTEEDVRLCGSMLGIRDGTVYFVHQSAKDWIFSKASETVFPSGQEEEHGKLAQWCVHQLNTCAHMKNDIFSVESPGVRRTEHNTEVMATKLQPGVAYACSYWAEHFIASGHDLLDNGYVHQFLQHYFLHWIEALSWIGQLSSAIGFVTQLQLKAQISDFLKDAHRFLLRNWHVIDLAPLQTYCSALLFTPKETLIRKTFERNQRDIHIRLAIAVPSRWGAETQRLEGHSDWVRAVAFSPDGSIVASGSHDRTVRLWDAVTGAETQRLEGHSSVVTAVTFSPDGSTVASGSYDKTVQLWDAVTGAETQRLEGHSSVVAAVAFSPDDSTVASGSWDGSVQLWDAVTGAETKRLEGYSAHSMNKDILADILTRQKEHTTSVALAIREQWVTIDGKDILWLPLEYRGTCSAVHKQRLAIGQAEGHVSILIKDD